MIEIYKQSLQYIKYDCIILDVDKQKTLRIGTSPVEYPVLIIQAPVPWHQSKLLAEHFMQHNLFIGNEILRDIQAFMFIEELSPSYPLSTFIVIPCDFACKIEFNLTIIDIPPKRILRREWRRED